MKKHVCFGIMLSLLGGKKVTANYLATKYETSAKTIYRAIDTLLEAGMPIRCIQGKNGGYELFKESVINTSFFTIKELSSFLSFIKTRNNLVDENYITIEERLKNVFDESVLKKIDEESNRFIIDLSLWGSSGNKTDLIERINKSIIDKDKIKIKYIKFKGKDIIERIIHPYSLVFKSDTWYLYAFCENRKEFRLFKLSRIISIKQINETFIKQSVNMLSKPWNQDFKNNLEEIEVELKCPRYVMNDVIDWIGEDYQISFFKNEPDFACIKGKAYFSVGLIHRIMEFGNTLQILSPAKLKEAVIKECISISNFHQRKNAFL